MRDRTFLSLLPVLALLAWGGLLLFTYYIAPATTQIFLVFFFDLNGCLNLHIFAFSLFIG